MASESKVGFKYIWRRLRSIPTAHGAAWIILFILIVAIMSALGVHFTPYSYYKTGSQMLVGPCAEHLMGTDELGRDLLTRIIYGSQLSISIGFTTALVAFFIGTIYGSIAGFAGGKVDNLLMRGIDIAYALPDLLVMILIGVLIGRGTWGILIALGLVSWMGTARLVRAQFLQLQHEEFVEAARAAGQTNLLIVLKHLLPNALGPIIVALTFTVPSAILSRIHPQFHWPRSFAACMQLGNASQRRLALFAVASAFDFLSQHVYLHHCAFLQLSRRWHPRCSRSAHAAYFKQAAN